MGLAEASMLLTLTWILMGFDIGLVNGNVEERPEWKGIIIVYVISSWWADKQSVDSCACQASRGFEMYAHASAREI